MNRRIIILFIILFIGFLSYQYFTPGELANRESNGKNIICFGNSLTYGHGSDKNKTYPDYLRQMLNQSVINAGVNGNTTLDGLNRIHKDVLQKEPKLVLIEFGANDFFRGISVEDVCLNIEKMIDIIQEHGAACIVLEVRFPKPSTLHFGKSLRKLAKRKKCGYVSNIMKGILGKRKRMSDRIHPNSIGYKMIAEKVAKEIKKYYSF